LAYVDGLVAIIEALSSIHNDEFKTRMTCINELMKRKGWNNSGVHGMVKKTRSRQDTFIYILVSSGQVGKSNTMMVMICRALMPVVQLR
jgi:hypothetical protein